MLLRSGIGFPTYRLLPAIEMGDGYSAGLLGMDFYRAIKKEFDPSIGTSDRSQSQVTECWQVSEFREFQRGLSGRRIHLCGLLGFRICPRSRNAEFGAFPFCSAIPADSEQQAASMSCFREARCRLATRLNDGFHYSNSPDMALASLLHQSRREMPTVRTTEEQPQAKLVRGDLQWPQPRSSALT